VQPASLPQLSLYRVHLDSSVALEQWSTLDAALAQEGFSAQRRPEGAHATLCTFRPGMDVAPDREGALVVLVEGALGAAHAELLRSQPPALLLACREGAGVPSSWELRLLMKLLSGQPLLPQPAGGVKWMTLDRVSDLGAAADEARSAAQSAGARRAAMELTADVMYELAANALLDAPVDEQGRPRYAYARDKVQRVAPEDACTVALAVEGDRIFLEAADRFGRLTAAPFRRALESLGGKAQVRPDGGGAGLGMRRMLEHSDACVARVIPGKQSKVMCVVEFGDARRRGMNPKSLLLKVERGQ
jgi:hypothetical protein